MNRGRHIKQLGRWMAGLAAVGLALLALPAGAAQVLTLEQALETARERNPGIAASRQDVAASEAQVTQARSGYLPQLSYQAGYDRIRSAGSSRSSSSSLGQSEYNYYTSDLSLSQNIWDFGQTRGKVQKSEFTLEANRQGLRQSLAEVVRDVRRQYYEALKQKDLLKVQEEALRTQEAHLVQAQSFYKVGTKPKIDVVKAEVSVANTKLELVQVRYALSNARVGLEKVLGGPPLEGEYELAPAPPPGLAPPEREALIALALEARPEVQGLKAQIKAAQAGLEAKEAAHWPTISAQGSYGWEASELPLQEGWLAGATFSLPLFSGLNTQGQISEARASLAKLEAQLRQQALLVSQEVSSGALSVLQALESISAARTVLAQAEENMALAEGRWRVGVGNAIEYADARLTLTQAKSNLVQASYGYWQASAELDRALGRQGLE